MKLLFVLLCSMNLLAAVKPEIKLCNATKEYVSTMEYLRSSPDFGLKDDQIRKIADEVSKGCSGAFARFYKSSQTLIQAGFDAKGSFENAIKFSAKDDRYTDTFLTIFKKSYLQEYLDMDLLNAVKVGMSLSAEFDGNVKKVVKDFDQLVKFCRDQKELNLPLGQCAEMAAKVTKSGEPFEEAIGETYIKLYHFLVSSKGPNLTMYKALEVAQDVISAGPKSFDNFEKAFKYAESEKGLALPRDKALELSIQLAKRSFQEVKTDK